HQHRLVLHQLAVQIQHHRQVHQPVHQQLLLHQLHQQQAQVHQQHRPRGHPHQQPRVCLLKEKRLQHMKDFDLF
ncbi:unnamed protein product, partial [Adineta steineri]